MSRKPLRCSPLFTCANLVDIGLLQVTCGSQQRAVSGGPNFNHQWAWGWQGDRAQWDGREKSGGDGVEQKLQTGAKLRARRTAQGASSWVGGVEGTRGGGGMDARGQAPRAGARIDTCATRGTTRTSPGGPPEHCSTLGEILKLSSWRFHTVISVDSAAAGYSRCVNH